MARGRDPRQDRDPGQALSPGSGLPLENLPAPLGSAQLRSPVGTEGLGNGDPGSRQQQSGKEAPGPGHLQMRQEGITHIPPLQTCIPLEQSRSCLCVQPGLGTGSQLLWERCGSLSFPTVSTCLEVSSYDLQGNAVSRFYCPEKEMGTINQGHRSPRSPQPQRTRGLSGRPGLSREPCPLRAACVHSLPSNCRPRQE